MPTLKLRPIADSECPPDKFRFRFPQDGHQILSMSREEWFRDIKAHYLRNDYPIPGDWKEQAENQLCQFLPANWCEYETGGEPNAFIDARMTLNDIINGTQVLVEFVAQGAPIVSQELADSRARTCAACYANITAGGCGACKSLGNLVESVARNKKTEADAELEGRSCGVCKCLSRAHVWLPIDILAKGITPEMESLWPREWCWKWLERQNP